VLVELPDMRCRMAARHTMVRQAIPPSTGFSSVHGDEDIAYREPPQVIPLWTIRRTLLIALGQCALIVRTGWRRRTGRKTWYPAHYQDSLPADVWGRGWVPIIARPLRPARCGSTADCV
jgi:hypothetical protein